MKAAVEQRICQRTVTIVGKSHSFTTPKGNLSWKFNFVNLLPARYHICKLSERAMRSHPLAPLVRPSTCTTCPVWTSLLHELHFPFKCSFLYMGIFLAGGKQKGSGAKKPPNSLVSKILLCLLQPVIPFSFHFCSRRWIVFNSLVAFDA